MSKVVKSVRIDEKMLEIIELYKKEVKRMFGIKVSTGAILSNAIVFGFEENLKLIHMMISGNVNFTDTKDTPVITDETRKLCNDYEGLRWIYESGEDDE